MNSGKQIQTKPLLLVLAVILLTFGCTARRAGPIPQAFVHKEYGQPDFHSKFYKSRKRTHIVIDPGHGGEDFGTYSNTRPRYHEKYLTLATARMLKEQLQKMGYRVSLSRDKDVFVSLPKRLHFAKHKRATMFVSIHFNSAPNIEAQGLEVFYYHSQTQVNRSDASQLLAESILSNVQHSTHAHSRGVKHGNFAVVRDSKIPAILIEGGFLTNLEELDNLKSVAYLERIAHGIAKGIERYLRE